MWNRKFNDKLKQFKKCRFLFDRINDFIYI